MDAARPKRGPLAPDSELWQAIGQVDGLRAILTDFYNRVYSDPRLAAFFSGVPQMRVIDKQYAFMFEIITGNKAYFGDRPRNAHHWMVIDDALFDHREALMMQALENGGVNQEMRDRWRAIDEVFRRQIVKSSPVALRRGGVDFPLEGWDYTVLSVGSLCDGCLGEAAAGSALWVHARTGRSLCGACHANHG